MGRIIDVEHWLPAGLADLPVISDAQRSPLRCWRAWLSSHVCSTSRPCSQRARRAIRFPLSSSPMVTRSGHLPALDIGLWASMRWTTFRVQCEGWPERGRRTCGGVKPEGDASGSADMQARSRPRAAAEEFRQRNLSLPCLARRNVRGSLAWIAGGRAEDDEIGIAARKRMDGGLAVADRGEFTCKYAYHHAGGISIRAPEQP